MNDLPYREIMKHVEDVGRSSRHITEGQHLGC